MNFDKLNKDIEKIYESTIDCNQWSAAQEILTSYSNTIASHLLLFNSELSVESSKIYSGWGDEVAIEADKEYKETYFHHDSHKIINYSTTHKGVAVTQDQIFTDFERRTCPVYNEFQKKYECQRQLIIGTTVENKFINVLATRPHDAGAFDEDEVKRFGIVASHVMKAISISNHLQSMFNYESELEKIFHNQNNITVVVNEDLKILWQSESANLFLSKSGDLKNLRGRLSVNRPCVKNRLTTEVKKAIKNSEHQSEKCSVLEIVQNDNTHAAVVFSSKQNNVFATDINRVATIVIRVPVELSTLHEKKLASVFKLTPSETKLAVAIAGGLSLNEYSAMHYKSINTVRSTVKQIFEKTGMKSQSSLANLVHSL